MDEACRRGSGEERKIEMAVAVVVVWFAIETASWRRK